MRLCENTAKLFTLQRKLTRSVELLPTTQAIATATNRPHGSEVMSDFGNPRSERNMNLVC